MLVKLLWKTPPVLPKITGRMLASNPALLKAMSVVSTPLSEQGTFCLASAELSIWQVRRLIHAQADHVRYAQL